MADPARARKVADRVKVVVAETLEHRVKDARLGFVTITDVRVTGDLQHATVFYTTFGDGDARTATAAALESARGKVRTAVGQALGIRLTPSLEFIPDAIPEGAAHLEDVLVETRARDAELARAREGKSYAGEADPYRKVGEDIEDVEDAEDAEGSANTDETGALDHPDVFEGARNTQGASE
ncbi:30S ribosome-binding factor RbfA [Lapillicoccus sp.]|uniref:30S ribosome-binding factor RbfA n=1 Tax=Lapillicoccus sp. TaxID=1909287 RepID=UPI003263FF06